MQKAKDSLFLTQRVIIEDDFAQRLEDYKSSSTTSPLLMLGDALAVLKELPDSSIDCVITSPPYWGKREYDNGGIGLEPDYQDFVKDLCSIFLELKRVLKDDG